MTDRELIDGLSQSTPAAVEYIYQYYWPPIQRALGELGLDTATAQDLFQEALLSELRKRKTTPLTLTRATYRTYFNKIVTNLYNNYRRDNRRWAAVTPEELTLPGEENAIERALDAIVFQQILDDALRASSELCREILHWCLFTDESLDQIAVHLGISHDAARQRSSRCKRRLREFFRQDPRWDDTE